MSKSMEDSLKKDLKDVLVSKSKKSTKELIQIVKSSHNLNNLFRYFAEYPEYKRLLFIHRFELFGYETQIPLEDMIILPYLRLCNLFKQFKDRKKKSNTEKDGLIINYLDKKEVVDDKDLLEQKLEIDDDNRDIIIRNFIDVSTYIAIRVLRKFPEINVLIKAEQLNYDKIYDFVNNHKNIIDIVGEETKKIIEEIKDDNNKEIDIVIRGKAKNLFRVFSNMLKVKNLEKHITDVQKNYFIGALLPLNLISIYILENLLKASGLSYDKYVKIIDRLYEIDLITHRGTISLCQNCFLENSLVFHSFGNVKPMQIFSPKCPNCHKTQLDFSMFSLEDNLKDIILCQDGLLTIYFGWLLKNKGIKFDCGYELSPMQESDFIIEKSILVEVKMIRSRTFLPGVIKEAIGQINKRIEFLNTKGIYIKKSYILWNIYKDNMENCDIEIITPDKIEELVMKM